MKREANKAHSFADAQDWNLKQIWSMTPDERLEAARILRERVYGTSVPDIREAERSK